MCSRKARTVSPSSFCSASPRLAGAAPPAPLLPVVGGWGGRGRRGPSRPCCVCSASPRLAGAAPPAPLLPVVGGWGGRGRRGPSRLRRSRPLRHPHPRSRWWGLGWSWRVRTVSCPWFPFWVRHLHPSLRWCGLGWSSEARAVPSPAFPPLRHPYPAPTWVNALRRGEAEAPDAEIRHPRHPPQSPLGRRWKGGEAPSMVPPFVL